METHQGIAKEHKVTWKTECHSPTLVNPALSHNYTLAIAIHRRESCVVMENHHRHLLPHKLRSAHPSISATINGILGPRRVAYLHFNIKSHTPIVVYGIHLWADLDCDRRVSGSKPNKNDYVFL